MSQNAPESIDLARTPDFRIGRIAVRPSIRQLIRNDGESEVLEPRVMQVLVALARVDGAIVSRDDLTRSCWEDRIVGEDAINRVISRLRRSAEGIGAGAFRIETITKVGYRLIRADTASAAAPAAQQHPKPTRRTALAIGVLAAGGVAVGGGLFLHNRKKQPAPPPANVQALMIAGLTNIGEATTSGILQGLGLFRRVTEVAPDYARGWGALAASYSFWSHFQASGEVEAARARALEASDRALALDPTDGLARAARVYLLPFNRWLEFEQRFTGILKDNPDENLLLLWYGRHLAMVGRMAEAADIMGRAVASLESSAIYMFDLMMWQWAAGRLDDADRTMDRAIQLFPRNFPVWFGTYYIHMFTGRIDAAIAMAENVGSRPAEIVSEEVESVLAVAKTLRSRDPEAIKAQTRIWLDKARLATGYAENSMQFLAAFDRIDEAFSVAEAYYLNRGWSVPSVRFPQGQGVYSHLPDRRTQTLFLPSMHPLWRDRRFDALVDTLGLTHYWHETGTTPDYRKG